MPPPVYASRWLGEGTSRPSVLADRFTAIQQAVAAPASRPANALRALFEEVEAIKAGPLLEEAFARAGQAVTLVQ